MAGEIKALGAVVVVVTLAGRGSSGLTDSTDCLQYLRASSNEQVAGPMATSSEPNS